MRRWLAIAIPSSVGPLPMHQAFCQRVTSFVGETQPLDRIKRITLLRAASAMAALNNRNALGAPMLGDADFRLELHVEGAAQPDIQYLIAHRQQRLVAGRIANLRQHRERPMRAAPARVHMSLTSEVLVAARDQSPGARRTSDFFPQVSNLRRRRIFSQHASQNLPPY